MAPLRGIRNLNGGIFLYGVLEKNLMKYQFIQEYRLTCRLNLFVT